MIHYILFPPSKGGSWFGYAKNDDFTADYASGFADETRSWGSSPTECVEKIAAIIEACNVKSWSSE